MPERADRTTAPRRTERVNRCLPRPQVVPGADSAHRVEVEGVRECGRAVALVRGPTARDRFREGCRFRAPRPTNTGVRCCWTMGFTVVGRPAAAVDDLVSGRSLRSPSVGDVSAESASRLAGRAGVAQQRVADAELPGQPPLELSAKRPAVSQKSRAASTSVTSFDSSKPLPRTAPSLFRPRRGEPATARESTADGRESPAVALAGHGRSAAAIRRSPSWYPTSGTAVRRPRVSTRSRPRAAAPACWPRSGCSPATTGGSRGRRLRASWARATRLARSGPATLTNAPHAGGRGRRRSRPVRSVRRASRPDRRYSHLAPGAEGATSDATKFCHCRSRP